MSKLIKFDTEARSKVRAGIDKVADAVKVTIGPRGRNVIMDKGFGSPVITNDGVSIAKEIELEDKFENIGAELVKEVATKTNDVAGDGTTTSTIILQALIREGLKLVEAGMSPISIRQGMEAAKDEVLDILKKNSKTTSSKADIANVASISAENKEMGELIAQVITEVGKDGVVTVTESQTFGLSKEIVEGMNFDRGYISPYMITDPERLKAELKDPYIIITDQKISTVSQIVPIIEKIATSGKKDIVIIAEDVEGEALATLVVNKLRGTINVLAVKAPEFGEAKKSLLDDIAVLTGGKVITEEKGLKLETAEVMMLGTASKVIATKESTTIIDGKGKKKEIEARISQIENQLSNESSKWDKEKMQKRLAKLKGGVAVIKVGAATETELTYMKHKMEDAIAATRAAVEEGIVAGGGVALARAAFQLKNATKKSKDGEIERAAGFAVLTEALADPFRQIVRNSGKIDPAVALEKVLGEKGQNYGYDADRNTFEADMLKVGIIDPLKVTRTALEKAVSVASILLTTEVAIVDKPKDPDQKIMSQVPGMGM